MGTRTVITYAAGIAGCAAVTYGLHGVMSFGCEDTAEFCGTPDVGATLPFMVGGIIVAVIAMVAGARLLFPLLFLAVGLGSILAGVEDQETFPVVFGGIFAASALLPLVFLLKMPSLMGGGLHLGALVGQPSPQVVDDLLENGIPALATILAIRDTGLRINDNPRVTLRVRLEPADGDPYEAEKTVVMSLVQPFQVGARVPALIYPADPAKFGMIVDITDPARIPPRLRALVAQAAAPGTDVASQLQVIHGLHRDGALSDGEFEEAKVGILGR